MDNSHRCFRDSLGIVLMFSGKPLLPYNYSKDALFHYIPKSYFICIIFWLIQKEISLSYYYLMISITT